MEENEVLALQAATCHNPHHLTRLYHGPTSYKYTIPFLLPMASVIKKQEEPKLITHRFHDANAEHHNATATSLGDCYARIAPMRRAGFSSSCLCFEGRLWQPCGLS
jgi:hypothetical protein